MTDERPRPQYGEYASPDEQAEAMGKVPEPELAPPIPSERIDSAKVPGEVLPAPRPWDRIVTTGLIALGTFAVLTYFPVLATLGDTFSQAFTVAGYGDFQSESLANSVGTVLNVVMVALYLVSLFFALRALRAGKRAFWIPLTAGVGFVVIVTIAAVVIMSNDPAFQAYVETIR